MESVAIEVLAEMGRVCFKGVESRRKGVLVFVVHKICRLAGLESLWEM